MLALVNLQNEILWPGEEVSDLLGPLPSAVDGCPSELESRIRDIVAELLSKGPADGERAPKTLFDIVGSGKTCRATPFRDHSGKPHAVLIEILPEDRRLEMKNILSILKHEIRTPLTNLHGFAELMLEREFEEAKRRSFLEIIRKECLRLSGILQDFVDLERMELGESRLRFERVDFSSLVRAISKPIESAGKNRIRLRLPRKTVWAWVDPAKTSRALAILVGSMAEAGVSDGPVTITVFEDDGELETTVASGGPGIPSEAISDVFKKSYYPLGSDWPKLGGYGLALARAIVEAHGGKISAMNRPGKGLVFGFRMPNLAPIADGPDEGDQDNAG